MPNTGPEPGPPIHVAVGAVVQGNAVLVARRPAGKHMGGLLEFPGGKVEPGESVRVALVRELAEEVAITADPAAMEPLIQIEHNYGDKSVLLDVWRVGRFQGTPTGLEGQPVSWMRLEELRDEDFPEANRPIIRALNLPREWLITGPCEDPVQLSRNLETTLRGGHRGGLLLRQPGLAPEAYLNLARAVLPLCQAKRVPLMLHGPAAFLAEVPGAAGIHLSQSEVRTRSKYSFRDHSDRTRPARRQEPTVSLRGPELPRSKWLGVSCHSPAELAQAALLGADYATLSPVNATSSHPLAEPLGWDCFGRWVRSAVLPVYALGGVDSGDTDRSIRHGGQGIAGISHWWPAS